MGRSVNGICPQGHLIAGQNVIMRAGGYEGKKWALCRTCFNARRRKRERLKYRNDDEHRKKLIAKHAERRARKKAQEQQPIVCEPCAG